jgi:hypothetical protein
LTQPKNIPQLKGIMEEKATGWLPHSTAGRKFLENAERQAAVQKTALKLYQSNVDFQNLVKQPFALSIPSVSFSSFLLPSFYLRREMSPFVQGWVKKDSLDITGSPKVSGDVFMLNVLDRTFCTYPFAALCVREMRKDMIPEGEVFPSGFLAFSATFFCRSLSCSVSHTSDLREISSNTGEHVCCMLLTHK